MAFCVPKTGKSDAYGHQLCKKWNDGRGCVADSHCAKSHMCDVLITAHTICSSTDHSRYDHDGEVFGWLQAQRTEGPNEWKAKAFWDWYGSPKASPPTRRDPVPAPAAEEEQHTAAVPNKSGPPWLKSWADELYYWDRSWNAILYDAARVANENEILRCPAYGCNWNMKVNSKSHQTPDWSFSQHLSAWDTQADENHPDEEQWNKIWSRATIGGASASSDEPAPREPSGPAAGSTKRPRTR